MMEKKMVKGVYAGTFDVVTLGHLDIIKRSKTFCDQLVIAVGVNSAKKTLFTVEERMQHINTMIDAHIEFLTATDITVESFDDLLVDYAKRIGAKVLIRGIRSVSDFEYEITLANVNRVLNPGIETIFLPTSPNLAVVSSSVAKEIAKHNGNVSQFVPAHVASALKDKFGWTPR